jgi:glycolate oxidase FAD binding subunit
LFKSGGRVVKNVAGYDVCKLLVGSQGTLAIVTQITLKLRPLAEYTALLWVPFSSLNQIESALQKLLLSDARPVAVDVLNAGAASLIVTASRLTASSESPILCLGVEGTTHEVQWQIETLRREIADCGAQSAELLNESDSSRLWDALTEFPIYADDPLTFQANLLPSKCVEFANGATALGIAVQVHAGNGIVMGQFPQEVTTIERAKAMVNELRSLAEAGHGNLIVLHCDREWKSQISVCGEPKQGWELMRRLKRQLDPKGLLNPGRLVDAWSEDVYHGYARTRGHPRLC